MPAATKAPVIWTPTVEAPLPLPVRPPDWEAVAADAELEMPAMADRVALEREAITEEVEVAKAGGVLTEVMAEEEVIETDLTEEVELVPEVADNVKLPTD